MSKPAPSGCKLFFALLGLGLLAACGPAGGSLRTEALPTAAALTVAATPATQMPPTQPRNTRTPVAMSASATAATRQQVTVEAKGNMHIRRGPDFSFNPIAVLEKGAIALPDGRDVLSNWVRIPLPGDPGRMGWISIMSAFTAVHGDVSSLAEIEPVEWPALAFLRNCTFDEMVLEPGGLVIPAVQNFPNNDVRVNPGRYTVHDVEIDGSPSVLEVDIREGSSVDILIDGLGMKKKCVAP